MTTIKFISVRQALGDLAAVLGEPSIITESLADDAIER